MQKIVEGYFDLLKIVITLCLITMVVLVFGNVVLRYVFNTGFTKGEELSRWCFVWLTFFGAIIGMREHAHLGVDLVVKHLPIAGKKLCLVVGHLLMLGATWLFLQGSWQQTAINLGNHAPATGLSVGLFYGVGVVFGISTVLILLYELYHVLFGKVTEQELIGIKSSEDEAELEEFKKELEEREHAATSANKAD